MSLFNRCGVGERQSLYSKVLYIAVLTLANLTRRDMLLLLFGLSAAPAVFVGMKWREKGALKGQESAEPFRIAGNFYYVGTNSVSSFLITGPEGHVVLDGGYPSTAPMIVASIARRGFNIKDVKV